MRITKEHAIFLVIFTIVGFITLQIPFHNLAGSKISFTLFDFFAPIAGAFIGPVIGVLSILIVELVNMFIKHQTFTTISIIRLFPLLFASYYFAVMSKKNASKWILAVPILAVLLFVTNKVGSHVWYYSLFWTIPIIAYFKRQWLIVRSIGSTFTAHAVGGAAWILFLHLPANVWKSLIPVVIEERILFAGGIAISYIVVKYTLAFLTSKKILPSLEKISHAV